MEFQILYLPELAKKIGINASLLASYLLKFPAEWITPTDYSIAHNLGFSKRELETARKQLVTSGFIEEKRKGLPCKLYMKVNIEAIRAYLPVYEPIQPLKPILGTMEPEIKESRSKGKKTVKPKEVPLPGENEKPNEPKNDPYACYLQPCKLAFVEAYKKRIGADFEYSGAKDTLALKRLIRKMVGTYRKRNNDQWPEINQLEEMLKFIIHNVADSFTVNNLSITTLDIKYNNIINQFTNNKNGNNSTTNKRAEQAAAFEEYKNPTGSENEYIAL